MTKNPILNALSASAYILLIVSVMNLVMQTQSDKADTLLAPITALFLLTLSTAVMAYLFFYQPLQLFMAGKKQLAAKLFVQTVGVFAGLTSMVLLLLFSGLV
jgi:hypothetical protein